MTRPALIIAGYGPVGQSIADAFADSYTSIIVVDPALFNAGDGVILLTDHAGDNVFGGGNINDAMQFAEDDDLKIEGIICCVSTPQNEDGSCQYGSVSDVIEHAVRENLPVLVKSTAPVEAFEGYFEEDSLVTFSPEFIQGTTRLDYIDQYKEFTYEVFGSNNPAQLEFWHEQFANVLFNRTEWIKTNLFDAIFMKYVANSYLATRVTFFNEMKEAYDITKDHCDLQSTKHSFENMTDLVSRDPRIGDSHMQVPGPDGKFGYGGHCLPKDVKAFIAQLEHIGFDMPLLKFVDSYNYEFRNK